MFCLDVCMCHQGGEWLHKELACGECAFIWESAFVQGELHLRLILVTLLVFVEPLHILEKLALFLEVLSCFGLLLVVLSPFCLFLRISSLAWLLSSFYPCFETRLCFFSVASNHCTCLWGRVFSFQVTSLCPFSAFGH